MVVVTNFISTFRECFNLSFLSANINWLTFPNTITWSIPKLTNVRHLQCCKGFQTSWFLNVCPFVVGKNFLVICNFLIQFRDFCEISAAWNFQPLCNFGHHFTGFRHPVQFFHLSQLTGYGWSNMVWNQVFSLLIWLNKSDSTKEFVLIVVGGTATTAHWFWVSWLTTSS